MHPGEVDHEVRVAREQPLHARGRALAGVGEDERRLPVRRERATECGGGRVGQLVMHDHRHAVLGGEVEDLPERGVVRIPLDVPTPELSQVHLAEDARPAAGEIVSEPLRRDIGGRVGHGKPRDHAVGVLAGRGGDPLRVVLLDAADAEQHHSGDVVPLHRLHVGVDRPGVRQVRVRIDQRSRVLGPGDGDRHGPRDEAGERKRDGDRARRAR